MTGPAAAKTLVILSVTWIPCSAYAQDFDDYQGALAMGRRECTTASIPYEDVRDAAERKQADVERWCKEENTPRSCKGLGTKKLNATLAGIPNAIKSLEDERSSLTRQKDAASESDKSSIDSKIGELDQQIEVKKKELEYTQKSIETNKSDADKRIYNGKYCVQARKDVIPPFREAMAKAREEKRPEVKPMADELIGIWDRCEKEHDKDIEKAVEAITYCERCKSGDDDE
jgi:chromosome segregation ATPase